MDATKFLAGLLVAVVAFGAMIFVVPMLSGDRGPAAAFDWQSSGYEPGNICRYDVVSQRFDFTPSSSEERKAVIIRIEVPTNSQSKDVKSALIDVIKRSASRDKKLTAIMALAYYPNEQIPTSFNFTAGKAVWGPGGEFAYNDALQPYKLTFEEPVKPKPKPNSSSSGHRSRSSGGRSSGSSGFGGYSTPPSTGGGGGGG